MRPMWTIRMFAIRSCQIMLLSFSQRGVKLQPTAQCFRSLSTMPQRSNDLPIKMENPFKQPQKGCILNNITLDYKNVQLLSQFISPHTGRIYGRHITGLCARKQRAVSKAIKKAHAMGFMSVTMKDPQFMKDPNICDIRQLD